MGWVDLCARAGRIRRRGGHLAPRRACYAINPGKSGDVLPKWPKHEISRGGVVQIDVGAYPEGMHLHELGHAPT